MGREGCEAGGEREKAAYAKSYLVVHARVIPGPMQDGEGERRLEVGGN